MIKKKVLRLVIVNEGVTLEKIMLQHIINTDFVKELNLNSLFLFVILSFFVFGVYLD